MLDVLNCIVLCIDIQEKLVNMLNNRSDLLKNNVLKILKTAKILNIDTILTEQYPKGLGNTLDEVSDIKKFKIFEKTTFSAYQTDEIKNEIDLLNKKNIILFGIETHICVYQTALDLLKKGYNVYLLKDCCASRDEDNHNTALDILKQKGATVTNLEIVLFEFLKSSRHPNFKEIQSLIK